MAAGLGFKTFTTGEVLTAADVNGYLMQGVLVFASAAARNAAITSPQEGQFAFTKDTNGLWYYDGAAWVASGATGDIEGVTAGVGISGGGTSGTVTVTNSMATAIDAKGDLVAGTAADTFSRLAVGANGTVLTADSAEATGLKWAAPASSSGPAFSAKRATSNQTFSSATWTKAEYNSEFFDLDSCYDSTTNYRFTPTKAGIYSVSFISEIASTTSGDMFTAIYKNGSNYSTVTGLKSSTFLLASGASLVSMNGTTDYLEIYVYAAGSSPKIDLGTAQFSAAFIRSN
jgi:hypothetical protein